MNYFAHGRDYFLDPYFLAGTAVPDWLSVVNRRVRVRPKHAQPHVADTNPQTASLAQGILRHHADDAWFHETRAFAELSLGLCRDIRRAYPHDDTLRPSFLGHILVELLLDAALIAANPDRLHAYYEALETVEATNIERAVSHFSGQDAAGLRQFIVIFRRERFLSDYHEDGKLWFRLNQVLSRVNLPPLPESFTSFLSTARVAVRERANELVSRADAVTDQSPTKLIQPT